MATFALCAFVVIAGVDRVTSKPEEPAKSTNEGKQKTSYKETDHVKTSVNRYPTN